MLANCEAKMGPAAHLLVNETSLSSTSNEHGQADHGAVCGKELVSIERGKCYHKTSSLLGVHVMCVYIYMWDHVLHHTPQVDCQYPPSN